MNKQSGFTVYEFAVAIWALVCIALAALGVWAAIHFIAKFW